MIIFDASSLACRRAMRECHPDKFRLDKGMSLEERVRKEETFKVMSALKT